MQEEWATCSWKKCGWEGPIEEANFFEIKETYTDPACGGYTCPKCGAEVLVETRRMEYEDE